MGEARKQLDDGVPFATVADAFNPAGAAGEGGDLGWISRGETVQPFEEAVFAMAPGSVSETIRTPFGLHLIFLREKEEAGVKPFEEVKDAAYAALAFEEGSKKLRDALDNLIEDNILNKPLAESAKKYNLEAVKTGKLDQAGLEKELGIGAESARALLATPANSPLDAPLEAGEKYIVARVISAQEAGAKPFEEARSEIEKELIAEKSLGLAMSAAKDLLEKFKSEPFAEVREKNNILTSEPLDRGGVINNFAPDAELSEAIFSAKPGEWLARPYEETDGKEPGALIVRVDKAIPPSRDEFEAAEEVLVSSVKQNRKQALFEFFMNGLLNKAKIEITNQKFIDRAVG